MRRSVQAVGGVTGTLLSSIALAVFLSGCGTTSEVLKLDSALTISHQVPPEQAAVPAPAPIEPSILEAEPTAVDEAALVAEPMGAEAVAVGSDPESETLVRVAESADLGESASALAQQTQESTEAVDEEYDPWEPFNEKMFAFNRGLDRFVLKPVARAYNVIMPEPWQVMISNGFDNIHFVPRMLNSLLQGKWGGAGRELGRFLINSTAGIGGLFDPAKDFWGIPKSNEDFGQTLCTWGSGPGPYVIVPLVEPLTVRDGIGKVVDGLMDPLSYFLPFIWDRLGMKIGETVNDRALNYDLFQGFEESVIDMYSAVRHGYLQRRERLCRE